MIKDMTAEEHAKLIAILESLAEDRTQMIALSDEHRIALLKATGRISRPSKDENKRVAKAFRFVTRKKAQDHDRNVRAATELRTSRLDDVFVPPARLLGEGESALPGDVGELTKPRNCYVCKVLFTNVHFFYDSMCTSCATLNYEKRFQTASLAGRTALITGARIKIGFQAAVMMLRAGARVIVTTRFPRDAAARFAREKDFEGWKDRLEVHGLDLRHVPSVELFTRYLTHSQDRLDILINNAAQTVRRPPGFYTHLVENELREFRDLPAAARDVLRAHESVKNEVVSGGEAGAMLPAAWQGQDAMSGIRSSALLSQVPCDFDELERNDELFPVGRSDADLQQIDLRTMNSWRMTLAQVPSAELLEVQLVNAVAPFILCSKLKDLMMRHPTGEKHIVNVSAMEGQFSRHTKTDKHPHTNMAKAALNMMTLTSAPDYAASGIFMNAVDTGWVTDEDPVQKAERKTRDHDFQPPLDIVDGAARICDPFFSGLLTGNHVWGKFLKDYAPAAW